MAYRLIADLRSGVAFADGRVQAAAFPHDVCLYSLPLVCYPGQEASYDGKVHNIELALARVDGIVIAPGEMFSFWRCVGRPTVESGFRRAAALKDRRLTEDVGGAVCFASTLLYNAGLLSGMEIRERRCHSVDSYGGARYFELGRDAAVEFPYVDLRFRNPWPEPMRLSARIIDGVATAGVQSPSCLDLRVKIEVCELAEVPPPVVSRTDASLSEGVVDDPGLAGITVRTRRRVSRGRVERWEDLGLSQHEPMGAGGAARSGGALESAVRFRMHWNARTAPVIAVIALVAAAIGGATGAIVAMRVDDDGGASARGTIVHLGPPELLGGDSRQPFCVPLHHFCIVQPETGHPVALYTYDTRPASRELGCEVRWDPERTYPSDSSNPAHGVFMDPCAGSIYDISGHRLFGPAPRDLDTFSLDVANDETIVDTRKLTCGNQAGAPAPVCPRAPLGD